MNATARRKGALAVCLVSGILVVCWHSETRAANPTRSKAMPAYFDQPANSTESSWDQKVAAAYLDQRAGWWMEWPKAAR
jgi:hypothetical protein